MLISLDWIKDFVELPHEVSPTDLGLRLTMGTAEVENVLYHNEFWKQVSVAEITKIEPHPEADKLNLVTFKTSDSDQFRVVCGAKNVKIGLKTPFAPIGTTLPVGFTLEPKKIRGILSEGMLCSEEELGLSESSEGIMELPTDAPVGETLSSYWEKKADVLFDIDNKSLTHRPDLWGHFGMAREFAALYKVPFLSPYDNEWQKGVEKQFNEKTAPMGVEVDPESSCLAYYGLSMDGIKVEESPVWLKDRLQAVGLRPINNIVDISNYVMIELGIPLHIFDRNTIKGQKVRIHQVKENQKFTTLDEIERDLVPGDTVISDEEKPLVLAGIMGGLNSGVEVGTTSVFIEVANWQAALVRQTSTRLGLRTDSSMRYEKTLDSQLCYRTLLRTVDLIQKLCPNAAVVGQPQYDGKNLEKFEPLVLHTCTEEITKTLGKDISTHEIVDILERLDFHVEKSDAHLKVTVPSYRSTKDIECGADIIEEVGRVVGYDHIPPEGPLLNIEPVRLSPLQKVKRDAQDFFSLQGRALEVTTYPMVGEKLLKKAHWHDLNEGLRLINSLSVDHDRMRPSLIPSFLDVLALNTKNKDHYRFFEWGRSYHSDEKAFFKEKDVLGICYFNKEETPFLELTSNVERFARYVNLPVNIVEKHPKFKNECLDEEWLGVHPFEFFNLQIMGKMKGVVFSVHPHLLRQFKIKGHASICLIDMTDVASKPLKDKTSYKALPKFPGSRFDYTVTLQNAESVHKILEALKKVKLKEIVDHKILDIYQAPESDEKHVTVRTLLQDPGKTLPGDFIKNCEERIISSLDKQGIFLKKS